MQYQKETGIREVVAAVLVALFGAALLVFTGIANLDLLRSIYPDPNFILFGLFALEGGSVVWTVTYMVTTSRLHKGICVVSIAGDIILSCTGFIYELATVTHTTLVASVPVIYVVGLAVVFNVAGAVCFKLIEPRRSRSVSYSPPLQTRVIPADPDEQSLVPAQFAQEAEVGQRTSAIAEIASSALANGMSIKEMAREKLEAKRQARKPNSPSLSAPTQEAQDSPLA